MDSKCALTRAVHCDDYAHISSAGAHSAVCLHLARRRVRRIFAVVDTVSVYLATLVGRIYARWANQLSDVAAIPAVHDPMRPARTILWHTIRTGAGVDVRLEFPGDNSVDCGGIAV